MKFIDYGCNLSELKKCGSMFEGVTAILLVVDISSYDQWFQGEEWENPLRQTLGLYEFVCKSPWFARTGIILIFTNVHLLQAKLASAPLEHYLPEYTGGNIVGTATSHLQGQFRDLRPAQPFVYSFLDVTTKEEEKNDDDDDNEKATTTTTNTVRFIEAALNDIIIHKNLSIIFKNSRFWDFVDFVDKFL